MYKERKRQTNDISTAIKIHVTCAKRSIYVCSARGAIRFTQSARTRCKCVLNGPDVRKSGNNREWKCGSGWKRFRLEIFGGVHIRCTLNEFGYSFASEYHGRYIVAT